MTALLHAELLKLRTTRTFAAVVGTAAALSLILVALGASLGVETDPHALFTNNSITYIIVLLGAIGMTGEWRHRTITGTRPRRARPRAAARRQGRWPTRSAGVVLSLARDRRDDGRRHADPRRAAARRRSALGGLADVLWRNLAVAALLGPLGVCIGALVRNQVVTVVGLIAVAAVLEPAAAPRGRRRSGRFGPLAGAPGGILGGDAIGLLAPGLALARARRLGARRVRGGRVAAAPPRPRLTRTTGPPRRAGRRPPDFGRKTSHGPSSHCLAGRWPPRARSCSARLALGAAAQADTPCLPGARCGTVTVPLDRAEPAGRHDRHRLRAPAAHGHEPPAGSARSPRTPAAPASPRSPTPACTRRRSRRCARAATCC